MKRMKHIGERGYVALIAVLIIGAAATASCLALLANGTDSQRAALVAVQSKQARNLAAACAQEALQVMHDTTSYTGTGSLTLGAGTCSYTVAVTSGANRSIVTSGNVSNVTRKVQVYATINSSGISVTSWQEVN